MDPAPPEEQPVLSVAELSLWSLFRGFHCFFPGRSFHAYRAKASCFKISIFSTLYPLSACWPWGLYFPEWVQSDSQDISRSGLWSLKPLSIVSTSLCVPTDKLTHSFLFKLRPLCLLTLSQAVGHLVPFFLGVPRCGILTPLTSALFLPILKSCLRRSGFVASFRIPGFPRLLPLACLFSTDAISF